MFTQTAGFRQRTGENKAPLWALPCGKARLRRSRGLAHGCIRTGVKSSIVDGLGRRGPRRLTFLP